MSLLRHIYQITYTDAHLTERPIALKHEQTEMLMYQVLLSAVLPEQKMPRFVPGLFHVH